MKAIEDLEAAYAAATQGEVVLDGQMVVLKDNPEYVMCDCLDDDKTLEQEMADAHLIALMKNNFPALIECAKALKNVLRNTPTIDYLTREELHRRSHRPRQTEGSEMNWTDEDERILQELQERKRQCEASLLEPVKLAVAELFWRQMGDDDVANVLIENATQIRKVLEPFDKEFKS